MKNNEKRETIMTDEEKTEKHELNEKDLNKVAGGIEFNIHEDGTCYICHAQFYPDRGIYGRFVLVDGTPRKVCHTCAEGRPSACRPELKKPRCIVCGAEDGWLTIELGGKPQPACTACYNAWRHHRLFLRI